MAGALDKTLAAVAKTVVSDLGTGLNVDISFLKQSGGTYNVSTGVFDSTQTAYFFKAPIEFIDADEQDGSEEQTAQVYVTPNQIGGSYPDLDDQIVLFDVNCQITEIRSYGGKQEYLYVIRVRF